jgi:plastocyanin
MQGRQFNPQTITLTVGQPVQLNIQNKGLADHNLASRDTPDAIPISNVSYQKADNDPRQLQSYQVSSILDTDVNSGHTSVVTFTPTKVGTFKFISNAGDDELNGMVGSFVVVGPGGQAAPAAPPAVASAVARDGQSLAGQSATTQATFKAVWGDRAAQEWAQEHNATLP